MSLSYLMKGLKIIDESNIKEPDSMQFIAKTKLNVSALYSELHRFKEAIEYAEDCLSTLQEELKIRLSQKNFKLLQGKEKTKVEMMVVTYVIAFYNIGVAEESLHNRESMREAFRNAVSIGMTFLSPDNEVLISAQNALEEARNSQKNSIVPRTTRSSIKFSPEMILEKTSGTKSERLSVAIAGSEMRLLKSRQSITKTTENVKSGRYYSDTQLKKIQQKLDEGSKLNFLSADQYFYQEISKLMNIGSDIKYLRPLTTSGAMS